MAINCTLVFTKAGHRRSVPAQADDLQEERPADFLTNGAGYGLHSTSAAKKRLVAVSMASARTLRSLVKPSVRALPKLKRSSPLKR